MIRRDVRSLAVVRGLGADRIEAERTLARAGITLPILARSTLAPALGHTDGRLMLALDERGEPIAAVPVIVTSSRVLPGHCRARVTRLSAGDDRALDTLLLEGLADAARRDSRCLRLTVELFDRDPDRRSALARVLQGCGFENADQFRSYQNTLALDLHPSEDDLFAALPGDTRRSIKSPSKKRLDVRAIDNVAYAARMADLMDEVFRRTGGVAPVFPWESIIEISGREQAMSHVVGVFDTAVQGPESLVSFAWGAMYHGYAAYEAGAATRRHALGNVSLGHAPLWSLVVWARRNRADWFDFGGVTGRRASASTDPVAGISAFKRSFTDNMLSVGEEWVMKPNPGRAAIADAVADAMRAAREIGSAVRSRVGRR